MNLTVLLLTAILIGQQVKCQQECSIENHRHDFPVQPYVIFGMRSDTSIVLLTSDIMAQITNNLYLTSSLMKDYQEKLQKPNVQAILIEVNGLLQFLALWQDYVDSQNTLRTSSRLAYFEAFHLVFQPSFKKFVTESTFTVLISFSDTSKFPFLIKSTKDNRLFLHQETTMEQYEVVLGRAGTKLIVEKIYRSESKSTFLPPQILQCVMRKSCKWMARRQQSITPQVDCIAEVPHYFGLGMLYGRRNLVRSYFGLGYTAFDCNEENCREQLRSDGGKKFHDKEVEPFHHKGALYVGARNGYIFTYRVINEKEKFSEILFSLDMSHQGYEKGNIDSSSEELYLFSVDGKETIALICGPKTLYRIYNTNLRDNINVIAMDRSLMTTVASIDHKCRKADYDAKNSRLIIYVDSNKALQLQLTKNHDGKVQPYPDPKLIKYDNYRGKIKPYENIETLWPMQLRNNRELYYNKSSKAIEVRTELVESGTSKTYTKILTNYGNYLHSLLYFPNEYVEEIYLKRLIQQTSKYQVMYYGIYGCTVFVTMRSEDLSAVEFKNSGCDQHHQMRALFHDSYMTVLRTKDGQKVEGLRLKVSISHLDMEAALTSEKVLVYTHQLVDSEFEKNNSFTIAPGTFNTTYTIGEYTYYQAKVHEGCTYHFRRRKITKDMQKYDEEYPFSAFAVSYRRFMLDSCDYAIESAMYDESARAVIYAMVRGDTRVIMTPNDNLMDSLKVVEQTPVIKYPLLSSSFPYLLFGDPGGPSVLNIHIPSKTQQTFNSSYAFTGLYNGKLLYRSTSISYISGSAIDVIQEVLNETAPVTKAIQKQELEVAAFGIETEIVARPEIRRKKCRLINAPFFMALTLKICVLDLLLTLVLFIIVLYHRAHIIPARRRYKIKMGILKHRKKRKLRDRARRRFRKLNVLRRRKRKAEQEKEAKRQAALIAAAVGALGLAQQKAVGTGTATDKKKSSSTSSSDMITARGENVQPGAAGANAPKGPPGT